MTTNFEFNAPQFVNFSDTDDPKADRFFDINLHEGEGSYKESLCSPTESLNEEFDTENKDSGLLVDSKDSSIYNKNFPVVRKALHEIANHQIQNDAHAKHQPRNNETDISQHFVRLNLSETELSKAKPPEKATAVFSAIKSRKSHQKITRLHAMNQKSKSSRLSLNSLASEGASDEISVTVVSSTQSKSTAVKRNGSPLNSTRKFISLAEQVEHFYKDTPQRYHSKPIKYNTPNHSIWVPKPNCVPKTPNLITKYRSRKVNFPDKQQREEMELEEIKKHQIKAHPLNKKIFMGPSLNLKAPIIKKPVTIPQPFSLTEVKKKEPQQEPVFHFKAQPVPITILQGPVGVPPKRVTTFTVPTTPQIRVPLRFRVEVKTPEVNSKNAVSNPQKTKVEPFSFDAKMKEMLQKKEKFVKKVIEEEKKSFNSFKAQPMPAFKSATDKNLKSEKPQLKTISQALNLTHPKGNKSFSDDNVVSSQRVTPFKARPAVVVHQKPFIPKLEKHEVLLPVDFHLNTEKRAEERRKFDDKIKQKEEEYSLILKVQKEEEEKLEKEKILQERKKAEFKAKPMPQYKVFEVHGSDPEKLTRPQSPLFSTKLREARANHLNGGC